MPVGARGRCEATSCHSPGNCETGGDATVTTPACRNSDAHVSTQSYACSSQVSTWHTPLQCHCLWHAVNRTVRQPLSQHTSLLSLSRVTHCPTLPKTATPRNTWGLYLHLVCADSHVTVSFHTVKHTSTSHCEHMYIPYRMSHNMPHPMLQRTPPFTQQ